MIVTHGINSLKRGGGNFVTIGGRKYPIVQIGNQVWLAENLDFKFSGLVVGDGGASSSVPRGNYYDNDESTYGVNGNKYGLLYNWPAVKYLNDHRADLFPGWHVPTTAEWNALITAAGGTSVAGPKLKATTGWIGGGNTDDYGFSLLPAGYYRINFYGLGSNASFCTATDIGDYWYYVLFGSGSIILVQDNYMSFQYSLRLVKDA